MLPPEVNLVRWVRVVLVGACALAVWLVASPALAAEPGELTYAQPVEPPPAPGAPSAVAALCDDRGATMLAPAPMLQGPESSLDVGVDSPEDCFSGEGTVKSYRPVSSGASDALAGFDGDATLSRAVPTVPDADGAVIPAPALLFAPPPGVRVRVERPPRG
jgi:hypothetical protein